MQCDILDWILEQKKDISGKGGGIQIKFVVSSNVPVSFFFLIFEKSASYIRS